MCFRADGRSHLRLALGRQQRNELGTHPFPLTATAARSAGWLGVCFCLPKRHTGTSYVADCTFRHKQTLHSYKTLNQENCQLLIIMPRRVFICLCQTHTESRFVAPSVGQTGELHTFLLQHFP